MQKNFSVVKKYVNLILDIVLGILGVFLLVFMASYLVDLATYLMKPMTPDNFSVIMQEIMLFEFIMMILRYIQEGHHIPIRYLILICLTAILRQLMVAHGDGLQTLLLSLSILLLVVVLFILGLNGSKFYTLGKAKVEEDHEQDFHH